ncbi:MAG: S41 family peptidase [Opitutales bacterium]
MPLRVNISQWFQRVSLALLIVGSSLTVFGRPLLEEIPFSEAYAESARAGDPHRMLFNSEKMKSVERSLTQKYDGIGVRLNLAATGGATVVQVFEGSPAESAGILAGDLIAGIDGQSIDLLDLEDVVERLRGAPGTCIELILARGETREPIELKLRRGEVLQQTVSPLERLDENFSYVRIHEFGEQTASEFQCVISGLETAFLMLDLRGNSGGLLSAAHEIADIFVSQGDLMLKVHRFKNDKNQFVRARQQNRFPGLKIAVLIDQNTASSAEALAGILRERCDAELVGTRSFGKGTIQSIYSFSGEGGAKITTGEFFLPNGGKIEGFGLKPGIRVKTREPWDGNALDSLLSDIWVKAALDLPLIASR